MGEHRLDYLVHGEIVVELKAVDEITPIHEAQVLSYLKAMGKQVGLILNFAKTTMKEGIKRLVLTKGGERRG